MGEAAKIALNAIGKQDTHLFSKDPEDSLFKYKMKQHSNFTKFHRSKVVTRDSDTPQWPFGQTIKVEYKPNNMGNLLGDMWIKLKLPNLTGTNYPDQVSLHLIKSITMYVDEIKVEELTDDWNFMFNELYLSDTQHEAVQLLTNNGFNYTYFATQGSNLGFLNRDILIPIHFFFSRKYNETEERPFFPLCAIHRQKITFEISFHKQTFFTDFSSNLSLSDFTIITEEIDILPEERNYLTSHPHSFETDVVYYHGRNTSELNKKIFKTNFASNKQIKIFHWFYRKTDVENEDDPTKYKLRFNFTSNNAPFRRVDENRFEIAEKMKIYLNGNIVQDISGDQNHRYFKYYTPYDGNLNTPTTHVYTYNLSLYPSIHKKSGILDFSKVISDKSFIETQFHKFLDLNETYEMHMYYVAQNRFMFRDGFMNVLD